MQDVVNFILELDKLKAVTRQIRPLGLDRYENSAEHSWQLAMFAMAMVPYAETSIDLNRVIRMLLVHDIGEIDAGDTLVFATEGWVERKAAELAGVQRVFAMLPAAQGSELLALWLEFEDEQTAESRFAHAIDRAMPVLLNLNNNGQSWRDHRISYERVVARVGPEVNAGCPALWTYLESQLRAANESGWFGIDAE
jgi:putative hydrolase of HD superfamily